MATDATGATTSPDAIPTYNTSVDAPSGLGFNAAMAQIQVGLSARVSKPVGIVSGETIVYNGVSFDRSSVTKLSVSSLSAGTNGFILTTTGGVPTWASATSSTTTYATTPPGSPATGDIWIQVDSTTLPTYQWSFRWNGGSSNADKWEFIGGSPASIQVATSEGSATTSYTDLATAGPSFTVVRAGVYNVKFGVGWSPSTGPTTGTITVKKGAAAAADADGQIVLHTSGNSMKMTIGREQVIAGLAASDVLKLQYKTSANTSTWDNRWISVLPVRVS